MLNGDTKIIAHIGYPTTTFKSSMIYNPWFEKHGINAAFVPLGVRREDFAHAFPQICRFTNFAGALITMPHKIAVVEMIDEASTAVEIAGSCNAVLRAPDGRLIGDMFDGEGFVRGVVRNAGSLFGKRLLIVGAGGVGPPSPPRRQPRASPKWRSMTSMPKRRIRLRSDSRAPIPSSRLRPDRTTPRASTSSSMPRPLA
jgi:shikimate 5-dehydrogenase